MSNTYFNPAEFSRRLRNAAKAVDIPEYTGPYAAAQRAKRDTLNAVAMILDDIHKDGVEDAFRRHEQSKSKEADASVPRNLGECSYCDSAGCDIGMLSLPG